MNDVMATYNAVYLLLVLVGVAVFVTVFRSTTRRSRERPLDIGRWKRRETIWFWIVAAALAVSFVLTIARVPWTAEAEPDRQIVTVDGAQFGFTLSDSTFEAGRQVEFVLRAADVNHGFGIYDPDDVFVAQGQMMPGHENRLRLTFTKPGTYSVACLEFCGTGHHVMATTFEVTG